MAAGDVGLRAGRTAGAARARHLGRHGRECPCRPWRRRLARGRGARLRARPGRGQQGHRETARRRRDRAGDWTSRRVGAHRRACPRGGPEGVVRAVGAPRRRARVRAPGADRAARPGLVPRGIQRLRPRELPARPGAGPGLGAGTCGRVARRDAVCQGQLPDMACARRGVHGRGGQAGRPRKAPRRREAPAHRGHAQGRGRLRAARHHQPGQRRGRGVRAEDRPGRRGRG